MLLYNFVIDRTVAFSLFHVVADGKKSPPYVDPNTAPGYEQNQTSFQPPPVIIPHASLPKGNIWNKNEIKNF